MGQGTSEPQLGELIQDSLNAAVPAVTYDSEKDPIFEYIIYDGPEPRDTSSKHDRYPYDDET